MHGGQLHLSASLDGHCGNMKSWRCVTCLLLFVLLVDLSMEGCYDNFNLTKLTAENLSRVITLKIPKDKPDLKDIINSSLMDKDAPEYQIYDDCIDSDEIKHTINVTSQEGSSHNISYYLFLCLMARAFGVPPEYIVGCEYELLCEHICNKSATDKTTAATTTTMATTSSDTTAATTTTMATTSSDTTAATTPTMATTSSDTTVTTTPSMTATVATTTTTTLATASSNTRTSATTPTLTTNIHDSSSPHARSPATGATGATGSATGATGATGDPPWMNLLIVSLVLNMVLPLAVYLHMRLKIKRLLNVPIVIKHSAECSVSNGSVY